MRLVDAVILCVCLLGFVWLLTQESSVRLERVWSVPNDVVNPTIPPLIIRRAVVKGEASAGSELRLEDINDYENLGPVQFKDPEIVLAEDAMIYAGPLYPKAAAAATSSGRRVDTGGYVVDSFKSVTQTSRKYGVYVVAMKFQAVRRVVLPDVDDVEFSYDETSEERVRLVPSNRLYVLLSDWTVKCFEYGKWRVPTDATGVEEEDGVDIAEKERLMKEDADHYPIYAVNPRKKSRLRLLWTKKLRSRDDVSDDDYSSDALADITCDHGELLLVPDSRIMKNDEGVVVVAVESYSPRPEHYYFGLESKSGEFRWRHVPSDAQTYFGAIMDLLKSPFSPEFGDKTAGAIPFVETTETSHMVEKHWRNHEKDIIRNLPHSYRHFFDFSISADVFTPLWLTEKDKETTTTKSSKKKDLPKKSKSQKKKKKADDPIQTVEGPSAQSVVMEKPNVVVVHHMEGLEIVHLYTGLTLAQVGPLKHGILYDDFEHDTVIESAHSRYVKDGERQRCYPEFARGVPANIEHMSFPEEVVIPLCSVKSFLRSLIPTNLDDRVFSRVTSTVTPCVIDRRKETGLKGKDVVYLANTGVVSSIRLVPKEPFVQINWQLQTPCSFDEQYDNFYEIRSFAVREDSDRKRYLVATGRHYMTVLDRHGNTLDTIRLPYPPMAPLIIQDYTGNGIRDFVMWTEKEIVGFETNFSFARNHSLTVLVLGLLLVLVLMYLSSGVKSTLKVTRRKKE